MHITDFLKKLFYRGGNEAHLAPEILNIKASAGKVLDYSKQLVGAAGVLAYKLAGHNSPFEGGRADQRGYDLLSPSLSD